MIKVPYISFKKIVGDNKSKYTKSFIKTLDSGNYINGSECSKFENYFSKYCNVKYATGTSNGTCALRMGMDELNLEAGSEVITPPNSFIASTSSIVSSNLKPRFVDIADDWNMDIDQIENHINAKTRAIMAVHLTGRPMDMFKINKIAKKHKLIVIEDAAQSIGAKFKNHKIGSFGDFACFSLHPLKNLFAFGDGGMIISNSKKFVKQISIRKNHGLSSRDTCDYFSCNCRLDEFQASLLNIQIKNIDKINRTKRKIAKSYNESLSEFVKVPLETKDEFHVYQTYVIFTEKRDQLQKFLNKKGIQSIVHYPTPIHLQPASKDLGYKKGDFPITERLSKKVLSLPSFVGMTDSQVNYVIDNIRLFFKS